MNSENGPSICTGDSDSTVPTTQAATKNGPLEQGPLAMKGHLLFRWSDGRSGALVEHSRKGRGYGTHEVAGQKLVEGVTYTCYRMCTRLRLLVLQCQVDE